MLPILIPGQYPRPHLVWRPILPFGFQFGGQSPLLDLFALPALKQLFKPYPTPYSLHIPPTISIPDRYRVRCTRLLVWRVNTPAPT
jgi:hypothetical protein